MSMGFKCPWGVDILGAVSEGSDETEADRVARKQRERAEIDRAIEQDRSAQERKARLLERATRTVDAQIEAQIEVEAAERGMAAADYRAQRLPVVSEGRDDRIHELWSQLLEVED
jgi:hypothetical protein